MPDTAFDDPNGPAAYPEGPGGFAQGGITRAPMSPLMQGGRRRPAMQTLPAPPGTDDQNERSDMQAIQPRVVRGA